MCHTIRDKAYVTNFLLRYVGSYESIQRGGNGNSGAQHRKMDWYDNCQVKSITQDRDTWKKIVYDIYKRPDNTWDKAEEDESVFENSDDFRTSYKLFCATPNAWTYLEARAV